MYLISCQLESHLHTLSEEAFSLLNNEALFGIGVKKVDGRYIEFLVKGEKKNFSNSGEFYFHAHRVASDFIMGLNVACFGHFTWAKGVQISPVYEFEDAGPQGKSGKLVFSPNRKLPLETKEITKDDIKNTLILVASLFREEDEFIRREYLKGIIHLGLGFGDDNFDKDAFANFYRLFEYFVTRKILNKTKLKNEFAELKKVISASTLGKEGVEKFKEIYQIRSEQIMHAQQEQRLVSLDDVVCIKVFLDFVLHKYYRAKADAWLVEEQRLAGEGS
jgi:hypothetical protein